MKISRLNNSDKVKYEELAIKYGTVFNTFAWLKLFGDKVQIYGIHDKGNDLIGGFHIYKQKRFGLTIHCDPPFTPGIGPFLEMKSENPVAVMGTWKRTLSLMVEFIEGLHYSVISVSLNKNIVDTQPFIWRKFKVIPNYTYILDLSKPLEDILKEMSAEKRNDINKAVRDRLITKQTSNFEMVKSLVLKTFSRQETKINRHYLDKVLFEFADENNSFAFVTFKDRRPLTATFCVFDRNTVYYLLGGYDYEVKHHGAGALATWEAIKYAKSLDLDYFDFEGSMVPQIERYLRGFGGELTPYYRINKAILPLEIILKFFKRELF